MAVPGLTAPAVPAAYAAQAPSEPRAHATRLIVESLEKTTPEDGIVAGGRFRLVLQVRALAGFPNPGESLRVALPLYLAIPGPSLPQGDRPAAPGFTRIRRSPAGARLRFLHPELGQLAFDAPPVFDVLFVRPMRPGEILEIVYGEGDEGAALAPALAVSPDEPGYKPFACLRVRASGEHGEVLAWASPRILPGPASWLDAIAPSIVAPGEAFSLRVVARDRLGNVAERFAGEVSLRVTAGATGPATVRVDTLSRGVAVAGPLTVRAPVNRIELLARDEPSVRGRSNPILVRTHGPRLYFGDLHVHSGEVSYDACGRMAGAYAYARERAGLDFVARTDHDGDLLPQQWELTRRQVREATVAGRFVAFLGFEWTPGYLWGHRSVLYPAEDGVVVPCGKVPGNTPEGLWARIARYGALAIPHQPSAEIVEKHRYDWSHYSPELEPAVEIYSQWNRVKGRLLGQDAETNAEGVQRALSLGYRLGFTAGSDSHVSRSGFTGGLAGVWAGALNRSALWDALRFRRTFATTGQRMIVELGCDAAVSGQVTPVVSGPVVLRGRVWGTGPLERVELVRGWPGSAVPFGVAYSVESYGAEEQQLEWTDPRPLAEACYYLRAWQRDGARAWTSPLWVRRVGCPKTPQAEAVRGSWRPLPPPGGWEGGALQVPSPNPFAWRDLGAGIELSTRLTETLPPSDALRMAYFHVRTRPFPIEPGARYHLSYTVRADRPCPVMGALFDGAVSNPGFFDLRLLPGLGFGLQVSRSFTAGAVSGPVRLYVLFMGMPNRYRVEDVSLERFEEAR
ncbi:MAG: DUF3604 domain-containing protein [Candidatus Wallbacteria bacterium]|nr:DUF3604 domain-containing protein [Candidatus Wallbacteria bacterium]